MIVNIKKLNENAVIPTRGSEYAAGYDLYALIDRGAIDIPAGKTAKIGTGISIEIPNGYRGDVFARSGVATNRGLRPANCVGVIDSDYRGEIIVALHNDSDVCQTIHTGDRIAQISITPYLSVEFNEVEELRETIRGDGGFGSSGLN